MPFPIALAAAALTAGATAYGAHRSAKTAKKAMRRQREDAQQVRQFADQQTGFGKMLLEREDNHIKYAMEENAYNKARMADQRDYGRSWLEQARQQAMAERDFEIERTLQLDAAAAEERARQRAAIEANTTITASERAEALRQLDRAQQIAERERQFEIQRYEQDRAALADERNFAIDQLGYVQDIAAGERAFDIGQLLLGQATTAAERETALAYLDRAQARADDERDFDLGIFQSNRGQKQAERDFQQREYRNARQLAIGEREDDLRRREMLDAATGRFGKALESTLAELGPAQRREFLGQDAIAAEAAAREQVAESDMMRMADRVASINEGNLIRKGIDQSTPATAERAKIAARLGVDLQKARQDARSEAVRYISGINSEMKLDEEIERNRRDLMLREIAGVYGAPIDQLARSPAIRSALTGPSFRDVDTGIYDRNVQSAGNVRGPLDVRSGFYSQQIGSAGNFRAPLDIRSTVFDRNFTSANSYRSPLEVNSAAYGAANQNLGLGMVNNTRFSSAAMPQPYGEAGDYSWTIPNTTLASSAFGTAGNAMGSILGGSDRLAGYAMGNAGAAAGNAGKAMGKLFSEALATMANKNGGNAGVVANRIDQGGWG